MVGPEHKFHRRSVRLKCFDYSNSGWYYITICVQHFKCSFGDIHEDKMNLSEIGLVARDCWETIPDHFPYVKLDEFIIMPNHLHGIIIIDRSVRAQHVEPIQDERKFQNIVTGSLSSIIRSYKAAVTKKCRERDNDFEWHRNFYEHIIRNDKELFYIRKYIRYNALKWRDDDEYYREG